MKQALLILLTMPFVAMQCHKHDDMNCHTEIKVQNTSTKEFIVAHNIINAEGEYAASYVMTVSPDKVEDYQSSDCWENHTGAGSKEEIYLLQSGSLSADTLISIDTLVKYNKLLKRISLNNDELKNNHFVITYL